MPHDAALSTTLDAAFWPTDATTNWTAIVEADSTSNEATLFATHFASHFPEAHGAAISAA